jgi:hypothetical protein
MAAPAHKLTTRLKLNLLFPQGEEQKLAARFLKWLISYGRFIVVIVEVVVLTTFATRFKLDADLANLKEEINNRAPYLEALSPDEAQIKQTQQRLSIVKKNYTISSKWQEILTSISSQTPLGVKVLNMNIAQAEPGNTFTFKITSESNSNSNLAVFLHGLKNDSSFKDVVLASVSLEEGLINFTITGASKN